MRVILDDLDVRRGMRRLVAASLAVAMFAASGGASLIGQVCRHHGGAAGAMHTEVVETPAVEAGGAGQHHSPAATHDAAADAEPAESHDGGECTCLGACQTSATIVAVSVDGEVVRVPAPQHVLLVATPSYDLVPRASQATWFLPPGNGPPALT